MSEAYNKITDAKITPERCGLRWVEFDAQDKDTLEWQTNWLLVQCATDRVLVSIDGPTPTQICYGVGIEGAATRFYISLDGAKRNAISVAMRTMDGENSDSSQRRKARRVMKIGGK